VNREQTSTLNQSTLWMWLHNTRGYPDPRYFKPAHLAALAAVLEIPQPRIRQALDESRAIYTVAPPCAPGPQLDALLTLEETLKACRQTYVRAKWVLNLVKALRISAQGKPVG